MELGSDGLPVRALSLALTGNILGVAAGNSVQIFDVSSNSATNVAVFSATYARDITFLEQGVMGETRLYMYVTNNVGGLRVFDVTNPADPLSVGSLVLPGDESSTSVVIAADGLHAYVGTNQGVHVVRLGF